MHGPRLLPSLSMVFEVRPVFSIWHISSTSDFREGVEKGPMVWIMG